MSTAYALLMHKRKSFAYRVPSARRICTLVVGCDWSTSKRVPVAGLSLEDAAGGVLSPPGIAAVGSVR
jgi:hypothetical protein